MSLSSSDIRVIVDALQDSDWDQATVVVGDVRIAVARRGLPLPGEETTPAPSPAPAARAVAAEPPPAPVAAQASPAPLAPAAAVAGGAVADPGLHVITSPTVGVFWRAPEPGAAPFVEVGAHVEPGDTIGIVEVMKLMSNVAADAAGEVVAIHAENAGAVEFGTPLVTIRIGTPG